MFKSLSVLSRGPASRLLKSPAPVQVRSLYLKKEEATTKWTKPEIDELVLYTLTNYVEAIPVSEISLYSNLEKELFLQYGERYGVFADLQVKFQYELSQQRRLSHDFQSGRELADWFASVLEQEGRFKF